VALAPYDGDKRQWTHPERQALVTRLSTGDRSAMPELRAMLDAHPETVKSWTAHVLNAGWHLAHEYFADELRPLAAEMLPRRVRQIRAELEGEHPTPLERLLCERVAACWLAVALLDAATPAGLDSAPASPAWQRHHDEMKTRAHRRYLDACVALARVRRLLQPGPLLAQVNIAQRGAQ
jgi:hypothetical protein